MNFDLHFLNKLLFITEVESVYSAVRTESLYRVIEKSLCTCFLYVNHHVHRDFLLPCITHTFRL